MRHLYALAFTAISLFIATTGFAQNSKQDPVKTSAVPAKEPAQQGPKENPAPATNSPSRLSVNPKENTPSKTTAPAAHPTAPAKQSMKEPSQPSKEGNTHSATLSVPGNNEKKQSAAPSPSRSRMAINEQGVQTKSTAAKPKPASSAIKADSLKK